MVAIQWQKPRKVTVSNGYLVVDLEGALTYPLIDAASNARALRAFLDSQTTEELCEFTKNWGLLYPRLESGRTDRFPLDLLELHRRHLLALSWLCEALRTGRRAETADALRRLRDIADETHRRLYGRERSGIPMAPSAEEKELLDAGVSVERVLISRSATVKPALQQHAAEMLATALNVPQRLRPVRRKHQWTFVHTSSAFTLEQILRWSLQTRFEVIHHFLCESCGKEAVTFRSDGRFCSTECSCRERVRRHRHQERVRRAT